MATNNDPYKALTNGGEGHDSFSDAAKAVRGETKKGKKGSK